MKKWDYEFVLFSSIAMDKIWELGKQGWELINIVPMIDNKGGHYAIAVLKRELTEEEES